MRGTEWRALSRFGLKMARVASARPEAAARCVSAAVPGALHRPCAFARAGAACRAGWGWGGRGALSGDGHDGRGNQRQHEHC